MSDAFITHVILLCSTRYRTTVPCTADGLNDSAHLMWRKQYEVCMWQLGELHRGTDYAGKPVIGAFIHDGQNEITGSTVTTSLMKLASFSCNPH